VLNIASKASNAKRREEEVIYFLQEGLRYRLDDDISCKGN